MNMESDAWRKHRTLAADVGATLAVVDAGQYTSAEAFEAEREKIFRRSWLMVARDSEVPNPGDFIKRTIHPLDTDALIVRGKDGLVRAFYNVCAHRGAELVRECEGRTNLFHAMLQAWLEDREPEVSESAPAKLL